MLARLLTRHGNRVGAVLYGSAVDTVIPARSGRQQVLHLLQRMAGRPEVSAPGSTNLRDLLQAGQRIVKRRSTLFVVSDFISAPGWEATLGQLAERHEVTAVRLFDPLEMDLPDLGLVTMRDAETGEQIVVDTHDRGFRKRFAAVAERRENELARGPREGRRRHPGAGDRRRPAERHPALRRPSQAAQPARQLERKGERGAGAHLTMESERRMSAGSGKGTPCRPHP